MAKDRRPHRPPAYVAVLGLALAASAWSCGPGAPEPSSEDPRAGGAIGAGRLDASAHAAEVEAWRAKRLERLTSDGGWLTVVGLHWLREGENRLGSEPGAAVALPEGAAPPEAGSLVLEQGRLFLDPADGSGITLDGRVLAGRTEIRPDDPGPPDVLALGRLSFYVIRRGERYGVRVKDPDSRARREFPGLEHFPISPAHRIDAEYVPYDPAKTIAVPTVLGTTTPMTVPGYVRFEVDGTELTLEPVVDGPEPQDLFFIFRDLTTGQETYPGGRFLDADPPRDGRVVLDFNLAYSPPCAFTAFATCPLPPPANRLGVRIEAGEKSPPHP